MKKLNTNYPENVIVSSGLNTSEWIYKTKKNLLNIQEETYTIRPNVHVLRYVIRHMTGAEECSREVRVNYWYQVIDYLEKVV